MTYHEPAMHGTRRCNTCDEEKHITEFYPHETSRAGRRHWCKACQSIKSKQKRDKAQDK